MTKHAQDFLEALLWSNEEQEEELKGRTVFEFDPRIVEALESFISSFQAYLSIRFEMDKVYALERSFGANCYFDLSGHGVGFWDDRDDLGREVSNAYRLFAGQYRFEQLGSNLMWNDVTNQIELSFKYEYQQKFINKYFRENLNYGDTKSPEEYE
jgi:hypothetical protein